MACTLNLKLHIQLFFKLKTGPLNNSGFGTDTAIGSLARVGPVMRLVEGIGHSQGALVGPMSCQ